MNLLQAIARLVPLSRRSAPKHPVLIFLTAFSLVQSQHPETALAQTAGIPPGHHLAIISTDKTLTSMVIGRLQSQLERLGSAARIDNCTAVYSHWGDSAPTLISYGALCFLKTGNSDIPVEMCITTTGYFALQLIGSDLQLQGQRRGPYYFILNNCAQQQYGA